MEELAEAEVRALMELQYFFPVPSPDPYAEVASRIGLDIESLLSSLRGLARKGVLKRVGYYYNYRSQSKEAALVAFMAADEDAMAKAVASDVLVSHAYVRDDPEYNVWLVIKRDSMDEIIRYSRKLAEVTGSKGFVLLTSVRTYKLSVKYDLYRGVSRSGPYAYLPLRPPRPEDLGVPAELPSLLRALPLEPRPYISIASRLGMTEAQVVEAARRLLEAGVLADPGAALDGEALGFKVNGMVVMEPSSSPEGLCESASRSEFSTHVVLRSSMPEGAWRYPCYAMIHARSRDLADEVAREIAKAGGARSYRVIYSLRDLKPGFVR